MHYYTNDKEVQMHDDSVVHAVCPVHGPRGNREACLGCNAAYMRQYIHRRSRAQPAWAVRLRAQKRAGKLGVKFDLPLDAVVIPVFCPILGVRLVTGQGRLPESPSLDRITPARGYVVGNCRVVSDMANRLKGNLGLAALKARALYGRPDRRSDYAKIVEYVDREELLAEIREKAKVGGRVGAEWEKIAAWLDRRFARGPVPD